MIKKILLSAFLLVLSTSAFSQYYYWGGMQFYDGAYHNVNSFNLTNHMIYTQQRINNWYNYLNSIQMQQMQQMQQMGIQYQYDNSSENKRQQELNNSKCSECSGSGIIKSYYKVGQEMKVSKRTCTFCNGTGKSRW